MLGDDTNHAVTAGGVCDQRGDPGCVGVWPGCLPGDDPRRQHEDTVRAEGEKDNAFHAWDRQTARTCCAVDRLLDAGSMTIEMIYSRSYYCNDTLCGVHPWKYGVLL